MNERDAFMSEIRANPYDNTVRLAYADWLEETGTDPDHAEFIRAQIGLLSVPECKQLHCWDGNELCSGECVLLKKANKINSKLDIHFRSCVKCRKCYGEGKSYEHLGLCRCYECGGSDDDGALLRTVLYNSPHLQKGEMIKILYQRGFISRVFVPSFSNLIRSGDDFAKLLLLDQIMIPNYYRCITHVIPVNMIPIEVDEKSIASGYAWTFDNRCGTVYSVPELFKGNMNGGEIYGNWHVFDTREEAIDSLGEYLAKLGSMK